MTEQEEAFYKEQGIRGLRYVGGVLCGVQDYLTTRGLMVGIAPDYPCERRYCYENRAEADVALASYTDPTDHPAGMWIKVKGVFRGKSINALNPRWPDIQAWDEVAPV